LLLADVGDISRCAAAPTGRISRPCRRPISRARFSIPGVQPKRLGSSPTSWVKRMSQPLERAEVQRADIDARPDPPRRRILPAGHDLGPRRDVAVWVGETGELDVGEPVAHEFPIPRAIVAKLGARDARSGLVGIGVAADLMAGSRDGGQVVAVEIDRVFYRLAAESTSGVVGRLSRVGVQDRSAHAPR